MRLLTALSVFLVVGAAAGPALGENEGSRAIQKGRWSIAISLPDGGGTTFGAWKMVSGRSNVGVDIGAAYARYKNSSVGSPNQYTISRWNISLQPSIKRYLSLHQSVSPYLLGAIRGEYGWSKQTPNSKSFSRGAGATLGLGADWTPLEAVSLGAHTGLDLFLGSSSQDNQRFETGAFGTLDSGLTMHVYF
jgi:hypothetical protein